MIAFEANDNGYDDFSKIQTFGTMGAKGILRDLARVAGFPVAVGSHLASFIPKDPKAKLIDSYEADPEMRDYIASDPGLKKLWKIALRLEGTKKSAGTHACGHIPTPVPCEDLFPVSVDQETGYLICQYNMVEAEHLGNLKKDLLMLRNLTIIDIAQKAVKKNYGIDIPLWENRILNDKKALDMIASGDTNGVFQLESEGMKNFMKQLKPSCFEDIIAGVALYRPGPMDFIPDYIQGKHDPSTITYLTPELQPILENTYGQIVYQEQVMRIVRDLAGFSMGRADVVRKAMGKKKMDIMMSEREKFIHGYHEEGFDIPGCVANGISEEIAEQIYDMMIDFAKYAFNKSHAACYAAIAMQTAYLKANYPLEFASGLLTSVMDDTDKLSMYAGDYKRKGLKIMPPNINSSEMTFTVNGDSLCYGLLSIKGIGQDALNEIFEERKKGPFKDFIDFIKRNPSCNKRVAEALIESGALDIDGQYTRRCMLSNVERILSGLKKEAASQISGQLSFADVFDTNRKDDYSFTVINTSEFPVMEKLQREKKSTGSYISMHPMEMYADYIENHGLFTTDLFRETEDGYRVNDGILVKAAGIVTAVKKIFTKSNRMMAFVTIEDQYGSVQVIVFPDRYETYGPLVKEGTMMAVSGKVSIDESKGLSILADRIIDLENMPLDAYVCVDNQSVFYNVAHMWKEECPFKKGLQSVTFCIRGKNMIYKTAVSGVLVTEDDLHALKKQYGDKNVMMFKALLLPLKKDM